MTLSRTNGSSWGVGDKFTSAQANGMDLMIVNALDKRAGQSDTLSSVITLAGAGRIIEKYAAGADADTTYLVSGANSLLDVPTLTANRSYTLSNTNAAAGDRLSILNRSGFYITVKDASTATLIVLGAQMQSNGESVWADLLFNGTAWVLWKSSLRPLLGATTFTATGASSYVVPRGVTQLLIIGWGGGGGGAGGGSGSTTVSGPCATGGGGGGGAQQSATLVTSSGGTSITVTIGAGGGSVGTDTDGSNGADTTFGALATLCGAGGGIQGGVNSALASALGGGSVRLLSNTILSNRTTADTQSVVLRSPGTGGASRNDPNNVNFTGNAGTGSAQGFAGGNGAAKGTTNGTANAGGGGGGGGGGPGGVGGAAGAGGSGGNIGSGGAGTNGIAAAANTGAGGGGGGGGGQCTAGGASSPGAGGTGGAGGSGQLTVIPLR